MITPGGRTLFPPPILLSKEVYHRCIYYNALRWKFIPFSQVFLLSKRHPDVVSGVALTTTLWVGDLFHPMILSVEVCINRCK